MVGVRVSVMAGSSLSSSLDGDAPRLCRGAALDRDAQHAVAQPGRDRVRIGVVGQREHPAERALEALVDVHGGLAVGLGQDALALPGDRQQAPFEVDLQRCRVDAGREGVDLDGLRRAAYVERGKAVAAEAADGGRQIEGLLHLALQAIHLGEHVARKQGSVHGETSKV